jgi:pyruvate carboxylase subunit B
MMADLKGVHQGINAALKARSKPEMTEDELVVQLFREVEHIWPMMGLSSAGHTIQPVC